VIKKEAEKILKYKEPVIKYSAYDIKTEMILIITGANETISKSFKK
jgi:hypothetical protein